MRTTESSVSKLCRFWTNTVMIAAASTRPSTIAIMTSTSVKPFDVLVNRFSIARVASADRIDVALIDDHSTHVVTGAVKADAGTARAQARVREIGDAAPDDDDGDVARGSGGRSRDACARLDEAAGAVAARRLEAGVEHSLPRPKVVRCELCGGARSADGIAVRCRLAASRAAAERPGR